MTFIAKQRTLQVLLILQLDSSFFADVTLPLKIHNSIYKMILNSPPAKQIPNSLFEISSSNIYNKSLTQLKAFHTTLQTVTAQFLLALLYNMFLCSNTV
jgi:hypothetical protein